MTVGMIKRGLAYVLDIVIILALSSVISYFIPSSPKIEEWNKEITDLTFKIVNEPDINVNLKNLEKTKDLNYRIKEQSVVSNIITTVLILLYFSIYQFKNNGQTIGKKILKIKVIKDDGDISLNDFVYRSLLINDLGNNLLSLSTILIFKKSIYLQIDGIFSSFFSLFLIITIFMIIFRKDKKGLHDLILKTRVVDESYDIIQAEVENEKK